jgi:nitroimidazol reductase NimA-like FMN-containing flavoprotein (pyridoxamine 5'-phosphate oxidase superfamily)
MTEMPAPGSTQRTTVKRLNERSVADRDQMYEILDSSMLCHIGYVENGQPFVLPYAYVRDGNRILIHGSTGARFMRALAQGAPTCITITKLDGLVVARSTFDSSMNYRSVVILGTAYELVGEEKAAALDVISDGLIPGRTAEVRKSTKKEWAATAVIALDLDEASVKVRADGVHDSPEDHGIGVWGGVVPIRIVADEPIADGEEAASLPVPESVKLFIANPKG